MRGGGLSGLTYRASGAGEAHAPMRASTLDENAIVIAPDVTTGAAQPATPHAPPNMPQSVRSALVS
jgi:hypothetical protein